MAVVRLPRRLVVGAVPAAAAPSKLVLTDASGDAAPGTKGDLTKLTCTTSGKTVSKKVGRKVTKVCTPDTLVVTLETADAIDTPGTTTYEIDSTVAGCTNADPAYSAVVEPVLGFMGPYLLDPALANDNLTSDSTYKVG